MFYYGGKSVEVEPGKTRAVEPEGNNVIMTGHGRRGIDSGLKREDSTGRQSVSMPRQGV